MSPFKIGQSQAKKGISSIELGRRLGITQTAAWMMKHKLGQVMLERNASKRLNCADFSGGILV